ncbi:MAG: glycosyltransferase [Zoogloeaceae bacterium]|jgi:glycosyltransferase involved in cell wall biosynthesis|nr:glycosyltransferase [Zoogloeaceae bacterium]
MPAFTTHSPPWILQFCHGYEPPFLDCARQYATLFQGTSHRVCTVYLTGSPSNTARSGSASDEVLFLGNDSRQVRGLKLSAIARLRGIAQSRPFSVCIAHRFKPLYTALLATNLPVIGVHHAFGDYKRTTRRWFVRWHSRRVSLLGVSDAVRDDLRRSLPFLTSERVLTLYNRLDVAATQNALLSRDEARAALNLPPNPWIIGHAGRLHPDKDQATLLSAFAIALPHLPPESLLVILGSGRLLETLTNQARQLGIDHAVRFVGTIPEGRRYFRAFDLFALSSDHEPFGMVLLEAMAAKVPVLCTACGGAQEIVSSADDLFPLRDAPALAAKLIERAREPEESRAPRVRQNLVRLEEKFSDSAARQTFKSYFPALFSHDAAKPQ